MSADETAMEMSPRDLEEFCACLWPRLVGTLGYLSGDQGVAEELAQETLARVVAHWKNVEAMADADAWAFRVALNLQSSWRRRRAAERRAQARSIGRQLAADPGLDPSSVVVVRDAVRALAPRQREAVVLRYFAALSVDETAQVMRCSSGTVKAHTFKGLANLRESHLLRDFRVLDDE